MLKKNYFFFFILALLFAQNSNATTQGDFQTWFNATVMGNFKKKDHARSRFKYWLENQERFGESTTHLTQLLLRPGVGYELTKDLSIWLGYAWIYTGKPLTTSPYEEDRIWQQLLWVKKFARFTFTSRTRTEQRFLENAPKTAYRFRQLLKFAIPMKHHPTWSWVFSDEIFIHKNNFIGRPNRGFDQNRAFAGLGYRFNTQIVGEFGYMNQYIRRVGVPNFCANIASINLIVNL